MATTAGATTDDIVLAGYFKLELTGLETLNFTNVSGLSQTVSVGGGAMGSSTGAATDGRTVAPPEPIRLTMQYVVQTTMDLWTWLKETQEKLADPSTKKSGTLKIMPMGGPQTPLKTWNLDDVYLTSVALDPMGASSSAYLTASISLIVGSCVPM